MSNAIYTDRGPKRNRNHHILKEGSTMRQDPFDKINKTAIRINQKRLDGQIPEGIPSRHCYASHKE